MNVDSGFEFVGFALVGICCYLLGQLKLDNKMSQRLSDRSMFRRNRRNRKTRYREPRFNNRVKDEGWLPPSVQRRIDRHIKLINQLCSICPISKLNIEGGLFDIQKLMNPDIQGEEYQQGKLWRSNLRNYLFAREHGICQYCGKKIKKGERVEMHHIHQVSQGGTDKPDNFALLHDKCHRLMHDKNDFSNLKKNKQFKSETFMNILRKRLFERFPDATECFGYETKVKREALGLEKTHFNDAFSITGKEQQLPKPVFLSEHRRNNRSLQVQKPGKQIAIRKRRYPIQPGDLIWIGKKRYVSKGSTSKGKYIWLMINGKKTSVSVSKVTKVYHFGTVGIE